jgi:hypothetical protein
VADLKELERARLDRGKRVAEKRKDRLLGPLFYLGLEGSGCYFVLSIVEVSFRISEWHGAVKVLFAAFILWRLIRMAVIYRRKKSNDFSIF